MYEKLQTKFWTLLLFSTGGIALTSQSAHADYKEAYLLTGQSVIYQDAYLIEGETVFSYCDLNCDDIDLYLSNQDDTELLTFDAESDAEPEVRAPYTGYFTIEVEMVSCGADTCQVRTDSDQGF